MAANKSKLIASAQRYAEKGQHKKAIAEYEKALKLEPGDIRTQLKVGEAYQRAGLTREACDVFVTVAKHYAEQGFLLKAVAVYKQILKIDPKLPDVHLLLAQTYQHLGLADAVNQYHEAVILLDQQGRTLDKLHVIRKMLELEPENLVDRIKLAEAYSAAGRIEEAVTQFRQVFAAMRQRGLIDDALKVGERLLYHRRDDFDICKELAQGYLKRDLPQWALPRLHTCFRARPRDTEVLEMLVEAFESLGQVHKAIAVLKDLAHIYEESGLTREYQEMMGRVLDLNPDDRDAQAALRATRGAGTNTEIVFDELPGDEPSGEVDVEEIDPDEEPGFGLEEDTAAAPPPLVPPRLRLVPRPPDSGVRPLAAQARRAAPSDDEVDEGELPFEADEHGAPVIIRKDSTSSGADPAEVISSATLEADARPHELPFEADDQEQDIGSAEDEATMVDPRVSAELLAAAVEGADLREELRELDFYIEQGFDGEATTLFRELSARFPSHPELRARAPRLVLDSAT